MRDCLTPIPPPLFEGTHEELFAPRPEFVVNVVGEAISSNTYRPGSRSSRKKEETAEYTSNGHTIEWHFVCMGYHLACVRMSLTKFLQQTHLS
jgi:hypothetical protein